MKSIRPDTTIDLITEEGVFLLAKSAQEVEFTPTFGIGHNTAFEDGDLSGLSVGGIDISPGASSLAIQGGTIAGLFEVRDEIGVEFQAQLDGLARDAIERFEGIDPSLNPGDPGLLTDAGAAFNPANESGLAGRIAVNAAVDPENGGEIWRIRDGLGAAAEGPSGNGDLIFAMLDAMTATRAPAAGTGLSGQLSAIEIAAGISSDIGGKRITNETRLAAQSAQTQALIEAETSATGVDTDEELQALLLIEQAYAANARVIQTVDEMLNRLLEI